MPWRTFCRAFSASTRLMAGRRTSCDPNLLRCTRPFRTELGPSVYHVSVSSRIWVRATGIGGCWVGSTGSSSFKITAIPRPPEFKFDFGHVRTFAKRLATFAAHSWWGS